METKICTRCGQEKSLDEFHRDRRLKSGRCSKCKDCMNEQSKRYRLENPTAYIEGVRRWKQNNNEKVRAQRRRRNKRLMNTPEKVAERERREKITAQNRAASIFRSVNYQIRRAHRWRIENDSELRKAENREGARRYYERHQDRVYARKRRWEKNNPKKVKAQQDRNQARVLFAPRFMTHLVPDEAMETGLLFIQLKREMRKLNGE